MIANETFTKEWIESFRSMSVLIPKAHYIFTFNATYNKPSATILLDVIFDTIPFKSLIKINLVSPWIKIEKPLQDITVPGINGMLGDKLTAFAPTTIGVPYQRNKELEIIKQLHDISVLFNYCTNPEEVYLNNKNISEKQFKYLGKNKEGITIEDVYEDTFRTSIVLARAFKNHDEDLLRFRELMKGISVINHFLITGHFRLAQAQIAAAKAAYLTTRLSLKDFSTLVFFNDNIDLKDFNISDPGFGYIQRFKKTNKEAFFYFYNCLKLRDLAD